MKPMLICGWVFFERKGEDINVGLKDHKSSDAHEEERSGAEKKNTQVTGETLESIWMKELSSFNKAHGSVSIVNLSSSTFVNRFPHIRH